MNIFHVAFPRSQVSQRKIVGHNVNTKTFGHMEKNYHNKNNCQTNFVEEYDLEQHISYVTRDSKNEISESQYLDSGCNNHMVKDKNIFEDIMATL